jgi:hypothetical protein
MPFDADDPPNCKRRWFQFSLRTLLIEVAMLAMPCAYLRWRYKIVWEREAFLENRYWLPSDTMLCRELVNSATAVIPA